MSTAIQSAAQNISPELIEKLVLGGDLSVLDPKQKVQYYNAFCQRVGLDPVTKPFQLLKLDGKEIMYADRGCVAQLNRLHEISHKIQSREIQHIGGNDYYVVCSVATNKENRSIESIGAVSLFKEGGEWKQGTNGKRYFNKNGQIIPLIGDEVANAIMKAETKAKRRATLDLVGLGVLDESEIVSVKDAEYTIVPETEMPNDKQVPAAKTVDITQPVNEPAKTNQPDRKIEPSPPPMTEEDKIYRTATNDVDLIIKLIDNATNRPLLRTFLAVNGKFFNSNPELKQRAVDKGNSLPQDKKAA